MLPRIAVILALSLTALGQTAASDTTNQAPIRKIIIEEEAPPRNTQSRDKGHGNSSPVRPAQSPAPSQPKQEDRSAPPQPDHTAQSPAPAETRTANAETTGRRSDRWLHVYVILAAALTLVGFGVLAVVSRQVLEMRRVRKQGEALIQRAFELREATERTEGLIQQAIEKSNTAVEEARAASFAASAARTSSESFAEMAGPSEQNFQLAHEAIRVDQRAWVFVTETSAGELQVGKPLTITLTVRNTGRTQAKNVQIATYIEPLPQGQAPDANLKTSENRGIIPPNATLLVNISRGCSPSEGLTEQCVHGIFSGELVVWVYGLIHYEDVFETRQATMFCYVLQPDGKTFTAADIYNDAT